MAGPEPVLVLISADPRRSHRAFEAMRIGTGIVAGENEVTFVLTGPAIHLLDEDADDLVDGDEIIKFRGTLKALGIAFRVDETAVPDDPTWNTEKHPVVAVSHDEIGALVRSARRTLIF